MARQDIYLGVEGNDGTGDSIRESFRKVNENFTELYAVFGQGGTISFRALGDTPNELTANKILATDGDGVNIVEKDLVAGVGITIDDTNPSQIIINNVGANVSADTSPILGGPLSGNTVYPIGNIATDADAVSDFNTTHGTQITQDDLVIDKKFADQAYAPNALYSNRSVIARDEPDDASEYTLTIENYRNGNLEITDHGFNSGFNGTAWTYTASSSTPANLVDGDTYYLRVVNADQLSLHATKEEAQNNDPVTRVKVNINNGDTIAPVGTDSIIDNAYDTSLFGFYRSTESLPRKSVVRRQGDDMEGPLYLHDHPGDLAGTITGVTEDLQAATKFYVDNTSFASTVDLFVSTTGDDAQTNSPVGKEGRSLNYAFRSLNKAAQKAEEIMAAAPLEPGAYIQTVTYTSGEGVSVTSAREVTTPVADASGAQELIRANKKFIQKEVLAYINKTYPELEYADTNVINPNAEALIYENRTFIQDESVAWINDQVATNAGIWLGFTYNQDKCYRDVGLIVDAMINDLGKGGNIETIRAAKSYWANYASRIVGQEQQTVASLEFTRDLIKNFIITETNWTTLQPAPINSTQKSLGLTVESGIDTRIDELFAIITNTIEQGLNAIPVPVEPSKPNNTCERDIGLIIDAVTIDIGNGTNANKQSVQAGIRYYASPSSAKARLSQGTETRAAIAYTNTIISQIVTQQTVSNNQNIYTQRTDVGIATPSQTIRNSIDAKFTIIDTIVSSGIQSAPKIVEGSTYTLEFTNGGEDSVDQGTTNNVDILPGKVVRGKNSGAIGRIVKYLSGADLGGETFDRVEVVLEEPKEFILGEELEYGNFTRTTQICIHVETGVYYEDYPIRVPANVSIKGSDFRRTFIRPADRISQSPWANMYFYRDTFVDNLIVTDRVGNDEATNEDLTVAGDFSPDEEIICTPADGISPLTWQGGIFYTDNGAVGYVTESDVGGTSFRVRMSKDTLPNLNTLLAGTWHIVDTVNYGYHYLSDPRDINSTPKNNKDLDVFLMNDATRLANMTFQGHGGFAQVLDPEGQILIKSPYMQVCGSFSQSINEQAFRGGMFIDGFSGNLKMSVSSKTDNFTLQVSSAPGEGLRIRRPQTPAPFFINGTRYQVDAITEFDGEAGTATLLLNKLSNNGNGYQNTTFPEEIVLQTAGNRSMLANDYTQVNDLGYGLFCNNGALSEQVSTFTYYCHAAFMCNNGSIIRALNCSNSNGIYGLVSAGSDPNEEVDDVVLARNMTQPARIFDDGSGDFDMVEEATSVYVTDVDYAPYNQSLLVINNGSTLITYEVTNVEVVDPLVATYNGTKGNNLPIYKLNIAGSGLSEALSDGDYVEVRGNRIFKFNDVLPATTIRPSTALIIDEAPDIVYRTLNFSNQEPDLTTLPDGESVITFDAGYDYILLEVDNDFASETTYAGSGTTMGATTGDRVIAIRRITSQTKLERLENNDMFFVNEGKAHIVQNYTERTGPGGEEYATVTLVDLAGSDITPGAPNGLAAPVTFATGNETRFLSAGLQDGETATITVAISALRANGHDFNDIGSGGFNDSNYPSIIYGPPVRTPSRDNEVQERGKGRVFWVSTDQDGFFRVGRFFEVDQGTGSVTFAASIALSDLDGLGFKRGVTIKEFSNVSDLADSDPQTVPTEQAVDIFINRRLHFRRNGTLVAANEEIGPGVLARDGTTSATDNISWGGNNLVNLADPRDGQGQDAATKSYVDARTPFTDDMMFGVPDARDDNDLVVWNGTAWDKATPIGNVDFSFDNTTNELTVDVKTDQLVNAQINANAAISQSKLDMQAGTTRADATNITQADLGLAAFDADDFTVTDGWVTLKENGIDTEDLFQINQYTVYGRTSANLGNVEETTFADVVNIGGTFTTTGQADSIVKTDADGVIDAQALRIDGYDILDTSSTTLTMQTPGGASVLTSVGTIPSNTTNTFAGSLQIGAPTNGVTPSSNQKNSDYGSNTDSTLNDSRLAVNWIYSHFIEAPNERDAASTGIAIGSGTGYSDANEIALIAGDNAATVKVQSGAIVPGKNNVDIGSSTNAFRTIYGTATSATYADLAENYAGDASYEPGTVVVFGGPEEVTQCLAKGDRRVAGVVTTNPAHLMNSGLEAEHVVGIALQGRVPCKVIGRVNKGDLLVTSAVAGYAIVDNDPKIGTVIGKAVGTKDDADRGVVEVVVGRV
jgi:hypothetical protein